MITSKKNIMIFKKEQRIMIIQASKQEKPCLRM